MTDPLLFWNTYSMDLTPEQVTKIQEIERQINDHIPTGPQILSQKEEKNAQSTIKNLLAAVGIAVGTTAAVILVLTVPFGKKITPPTSQMTTSTVQVEPNITVQATYVNPFSQTAQYNNPFIASQNPFSSLTQ